MYKVSFIFFLFFVTQISVNAQNVEFAFQHKVFKCTEPVIFEDFFKTNLTAFRMSTGTEMIDVTRIGNKYADNHKKYKQTYNGIEVYGVSYYLHGKDGLVTHGTGTFLPDIQLDINPGIDIKTAENKAILSIRNVLKMPFVQSNEAKRQMAGINLLAKEKGLVIVDKSFPGYSGSYELAYRFEVFSDFSLTKYEVIVSAMDGKMIFNQSMIHHGQADGIGKTFYYGNQKIVTDSISPDQFVLRDLSRGQGITTYTHKNGVEIKEFFDKDNIWDDVQAVDLVGIDAHYCTEKFYDMMVEYCGYSGLDGEGLSFNPVVYANGENNFINAYWDGDKAYFGQGNCHYGPLVTHSVVSHEFTHGVTQYNSNLIYSGESGAINESLSDIFGKSSEYLFDRSRFSWDLGPEFALDQFAENFRSMSDPNSYEHPKTYKGLFWKDEADVHVNSSVFNHWYYLMIEGGSGQNEEGAPYNIKPVSIKDALDVVFLCQTSYLTPSSGYVALYDYTLLACEALFGIQSDQYKSVVEAWKAVGLPYEITSDITRDLSISSQVVYEVTCLYESFYSLVLTVKNEGITNIAQGQALIFDILDNGSSEQVTLALSEDLLPGQSKVLTIDNLIYFFGDDFKFLQIRLNYEDDNEINNEIGIYLDNYAAVGPDLVFSSVVAKSTCFTEERKIEGYILNYSCYDIPKNTEFKVVVNDGSTIVHKKNLFTNNILSSGEYYYFTFDLNLDLGEYGITLECDIDTNIENNNDDLRFEGLSGTIVSPVKYTFDDQSFQEMFNISNELIDFNKYQNENYLTSVGDSGGDVPCLNASSNFDDQIFSSNTTSAETCLDLTGFSVPKLSFDLRQYRSSYLSQFGIDSLSAISSVMKISYKNDTQEFTDYIYGQQEGLKVAHNYLLPQGFKGLFSMSFYNNYGYQSFSPSRLPEVDAMLLDNLNIENSSATIDIPIDDQLSIYPNPGNELISIESNVFFQGAFTMLNSQGQQLMQIHNIQNGAKINISAFGAGYYVMKFVTNNGVIIMKPFVKI